MKTTIWNVKIYTWLLPSEIYEKLKDGKMTYTTAVGDFTVEPYREEEPEIKDELSIWALTVIHLQTKHSPWANYK